MTITRQWHQDPNGLSGTALFKYGNASMRFHLQNEQAFTDLCHLLDTAEGLGRRTILKVFLNSLESLEELP